MYSGSKLSNTAINILCNCEAGYAPQAQLGVVLQILSARRDLHLCAVGALFLADSDGSLVMVARCGLGDHEADLTRSALATSPTDVESSLDSSRSEIAVGAFRMVVLHLVDREALLGVVAVRQAPSFEWDAHKTEVLQDVALAISQVAARAICSAIIELREFEIEQAEYETIRLLSSAEECRDLDTSHHTLRVAHYSRAIGETAGLAASDVDLLFRAAPLHDIGKIGVTDTILRDPCLLSASAFRQIKDHTLIGEHILSGTTDLISAARIIAGSHHEKWDGTGYPRGLRGESIPLFGRICAIADVFDALGTARSYKKAWKLEDILTHIRASAGSHFDPALVDAFFVALPEILKFRAVYSDDLTLDSSNWYLPEVAAAATDGLVWSDDFLTGIQLIDVHHKYLFELANRLGDELAGNCRVREIAAAFKALEAYARLHFREEELLMSQINYEYTHDHMQEHAAFMTIVKDNWSMYRNNPLLLGHKILDFVKIWLISHVKGSDKRAAAVILENKACVLPQEPTDSDNVSGGLSR